MTGAENVYPIEVETALAEHPEVADVAVIGVIGVPDEKWGETVKAVVRAPRLRAHRGAAAGVVQGPHRRVQAPAVGGLRRGAAAQPVRQSCSSGCCVSRTGLPQDAVSPDAG